MITIDPLRRIAVATTPGFYWVRRSLPSGNTAVEPAELTSHGNWKPLGDSGYYPANSPDIVPLRDLHIPENI